MLYLKTRQFRQNTEITEFIAILPNPRCLRTNSSALNTTSTHEENKDETGVNVFRKIRSRRLSGLGVSVIKMLPRNQIMSAQQANAIMLQQQQQQRRIHRGALPTVIPHNSANLESQLLCNYNQYLCKREKLPQQDFCSRHILEDKNSAYKQCNFEYKVTKRRCSRPAPKTDRKDG